VQLPRENTLTADNLQRLVNELKATRRHADKAPA
jgi:hypothetical protein